ncbi:hypothetical protein [uncultured Gammaproteobacteria bacterium]|nr:hypothetical protein [uncultured Gammaproteobacteria bacterium]CAC9652806.1 hypothetical protein [uncultured Gammaproteobacteria bacterium]SSC08968.1 hypothetical protein BTURTLESOX_1818 [bacterium endosymbiont of Bathymodiolus sp. 5 South]VVH57246.1 hypothetical protein BSPCLSOX_2370 [uncultured Gammaproteobacteria bacterium]VVH63976.1 hypothetical protein BSPWISOX_2387 [uncultured Gammaproteobacteria bacterium]
MSRSSAGNWNNYRRHLRALLQTAIEFKVIKGDLCINRDD